MALGLGWEFTPGLAGGKRVVEAREARPAQTPGYIVGGGRVAFGRREQDVQVLSVVLGARNGQPLDCRRGCHLFGEGICV